MGWVVGLGGVVGRGWVWVGAGLGWFGPVSLCGLGSARLGDGLGCQQRCVGFVVLGKTVWVHLVGWG